MPGRLDRIPGVVLVSIAAAMWGLDGLIRKPLADSTSAYTIVFGEHVALVLVTLPLLVPAMVALWRAGPAYVAAGVMVGAGASAIATILFTKAIFHGDFITVVVLQQVQPLIVVVGAWLVLGEQPRRGFFWFLLAALVGVWLISLPHPLEPHAHGLIPVAETLAAATLWAMGTVFGRFLTRRLRFEHVMTVVVVDADSIAVAWCPQLTVNVVAQQAALARCDRDDAQLPCVGRVRDRRAMVGPDRRVDRGVAN